MADTPEQGDVPEDRRELLRREYHGQTARIHWEDLQVHYARGAVVCAAPGMNLVEVAIELGMDNTAQFEAWIEADQISRPTEEQAREWFENNTEFWAVVAAPWVLVQVFQAAD